MTAADALALIPGNRVRHRWQPAWMTNPPARTVVTVLRVEYRKGNTEVRVVAAEGFGFLPWEVDHAPDDERR